MRLNKPVLVTTVVLLIALFFACTHQVVNPGDNGNNNNGGDTTGNGNGNGGGGNNDSLICFEEQILPLFQTNCAKSGCHDAKSRKEGYVLDSYDNIVARGIVPGNAKSSKLYQVLLSSGEEDERMPPSPNPPLTSQQINLIAQWINEGAQNTTNCSTGCDTSLFTYSGAVQPILALHCTACHNNTTQSSGVNLSTYSGVQTVALNGKLEGSITWSTGFVPMPQNSQQLSDCNIEQITKWINAGAPNN